MSGWLAGLDAFLVGLAYLVALLTTRFVVRPLLVSILGSAPIVGGWLASNVDNGIGNFERAIMPAANASMGTIVSALDWLTTQGRAVLNGVGDTAEATYAALYHLGSEALHQVVGASTQWVEGLVEAARGYALGLLQTAEHDIETSFSRAEADAAALVSVTEGALRSEISGAEKIVLDEIRKGEQVTGQLFQQAEYDAGQLVAASEVKLADLVKSARADLGAAVGAVEHDLQLLAQAERVALEDSTSILGGDINAAEARAQAAIGALEESTRKSIEGILSGLPWQSLAAAVGAGEAMLQADVRTLVGLGAKAIRDELGNAEALRAKYGPQIKDLLASVRPAG